MPQTLTQQMAMLAVLLPPAAVTLALVLRLRPMAAATLRRFPSRQAAGLTFLDLLALPLLLLAGAALLGAAVAVVRQKGGLTPFMEGDAMGMAVGALMGQALTQAPIVVYALVRLGWSRPRWHAFGFHRSRPGRLILAGLAAFLVAVVLMTPLSGAVTIVGELLGRPAPDLGHRLLLVFRDSQDPVAIGLLLLSTIIMAPVLEEIIFRGLVHSSLAGAMGDQAVGQRLLVAAAIFMAIHLDAVAWQVLPALFLLGLILGWVYERTSSLLPCILAHMLFNAANIAIVVWLM